MGIRSPSVLSGVVDGNPSLVPTRCPKLPRIPSLRMVESAATPGIPTTTTGAVLKSRSPVIRGVYLVLGLICLGFTYMSWLPGIPTVDFVILAAFFFARSSDRFHGWLVGHRVFGRIIAAYSGGGLTMRTKIVAAVGITASLAFSGIVLVDNLVVRIILAAVGVFALWYVFSRPTRAPSKQPAGLQPASPQPPETA